MNTPTQILPDGYVESDEINLKKNKRLAILLSILAFSSSASVLPCFHFRKGDSLGDDEDVRKHINGLDVDYARIDGFYPGYS